MKITCPKHGEVEARVTKDYSAYCPECLEEAARQVLDKFKDMPLNVDYEKMRYPPGSYGTK